MTSKSKKGKFSLLKALGGKSAEEKEATEVFCWGKVPASYDSFKMSETGEKAGLIPVSKIGLEADNETIVSLAANSSHIVAVSNNNKLHGSGENDSGQLYPLSKSSKIIPFKLFKPLKTQREAKVVQVSCGKDFTAYLTSYGRIYTFGNNTCGQLGHSSDRTPYSVPARMVRGIPHEICVQVCCGDYSTYALTRQGKVYACGFGKNGRLGVSNISKFVVEENKNSKTPVFISEMIQDPNFDLQQEYLESNRNEMEVVNGPLHGAPVVHISAGSAHCVAVTAAGGVFGWGSNSHGQLGLKNPDLVLAEGKAFAFEVDSDMGEDESYLNGVPIPVALNVDNVSFVEAGGNHTTFISADRTELFAVGDNGNMQLGPIEDSTLKTTSKISKVNFDEFGNEYKAAVAKVACGLDHTVVLFDNGNASIFGLEQPSEFSDKVGEIESQPGVTLLTGGQIFDVVSGGRLCLALTSPDNLSLIKQKVDQTPILKTKIKIGLNKTDVLDNDKKAAFLKLRRVMFDMNSLNASFLLDNKKRQAREAELSESAIDGVPLQSSFVDLEGMMESMRSFIEVSKSEESKLKVRQLIATLVSQLDFSASSVTEADQLRAYFMLCFSPLLQEVTPTEHEILMVSIFKLPLETRRRFFSWIIADVATKNINTLLEALVKPLLRQLDVHIKRRKYTKQAVYLCKFLHSLYLICEKMNEKSSAEDLNVLNATPHVPSSAFYTEALDNFPDTALDQMYKRWHAVVTRGGEALNGPRNMRTGIFGMPLMPEEAQNAIKRQSSSDSLSSNGEGFDFAKDKPTFGLEGFGAQLLSVVDDSLEDTLNDIAPELVIFKHPFLLSANMKRRFMHIEDKSLQMTQFLRFYTSGIDPNLVLNVQRGDKLIDDTFDALRTLKDKASIYLRRPLRIKFVGEEGLDAGGVRKEFFLLLSAELFSPKFGYFAEIGDSHTLWFNNTIDPTLLASNTSTSLSYQDYLNLVRRAERFENRLEDISIIGTIMGLAVYNDTLLDVQFPSAMYELLLNKLKEENLTLAKYKQFDPSGARQLEYILNIEDPEELESLDMTYEIVQEALGVLKEIEICENGKNKKVTMENRNDYVHTYIKFKMLSPFIRSQAKALTEGFTRVITSQQAALNLFHPDELELLLCGTPELDFKLLEEKCTYEGGYNATHPTIKTFWEILHEFDFEQRKMLLKFSTGSSRAPVGGLKNVKFKIQRAGPDSHQLPTSHTCFNTLMLPDYCSKEKMKRLLLLAIANSEGFGLQ